MARDRDLGIRKIEATEFYSHAKVIRKNLRVPDATLSWTITYRLLGNTCQNRKCRFKVDAPDELSAPDESIRLRISDSVLHELCLLTDLSRKHLMQSIPDP